MKTIKVITSIIVLFISISIQAQTSSTSTSTTSSHSDSDDEPSSYSYSHSLSSNDGNTKTKVSFSVSSSNDTYSLIAKIPSDLYQEVKEVLLKEMSDKNHLISNGRDSWTSESNGEEVYKVSLSSKKLTMFLDKESASNRLVEKFEALGKTLRTVVVGEQNEERREAERMQREADWLLRDAERMQREADRMQREAERHNTASAERYKDDARRIADEAKRMADEASDLNLEATHKGAISSIVRQLLADSKTAYNETTKSAYNWIWPLAQKELLIAFTADKSIDTDSDIVLIKDQTGIHINGKHLSKNQAKKYNSILAKHEISKTHYFTFYKSNNHIVLVNNNANLKNFLEDVVSKNLIKSDRKKVKLEMNGNSAYINDNKLSENELSQLNTILMQNNIIPAPGKIFEIIKSKNYKLGYSVDGRTHLGTWVMRN